MGSMDAGFSVFGLLTLALVLFVVVGFVVLLVLVITRSRSGKASPQPDFPPPETAAPDTREERTAILEQLAKKEISKEEAEARMAGLGAPVPRDMPENRKNEAAKNAVRTLWNAAGRQHRAGRVSRVHRLHTAYGPAGLRDAGGERPER